MPAPEPATPTVAAPAPMNFAAESMSFLADVVVNARLAFWNRKDKNMIRNISKIRKINLQLLGTYHYGWSDRSLTLDDEVSWALDSNNTSEVSHCDLGLLGLIWWKLVLQVASRKCLKWKMPQQQTNSKMAMIRVSNFNFGKPNSKQLIIWQFWELFGYIF